MRTFIRNYRTFLSNKYDNIYILICEETSLTIKIKTNSILRTFLHNKDENCYT